MLKKHTRNLVAQKLVHKDFINDILDKFTNFYKECTAMRRQRQSKPHIN